MTQNNIDFNKRPASAMEERAEGAFSQPQSKRVRFSIDSSPTAEDLYPSSPFDILDSATAGDTLLPVTPSPPIGRHGDISLMALQANLFAKNVIASAGTAAVHRQRQRQRYRRRSSVTQYSLQRNALIVLRALDFQVDE